MGTAEGPRFSERMRANVGAGRRGVRAVAPRGQSPSAHGCRATPYWSRRLRGALSRSSSCSAGTNGACRRQVRNIRHGFQDGIYLVTRLSIGTCGVARAPRQDTPLCSPPRKQEGGEKEDAWGRIERAQGAARRSIVPTRAPVAKSMTTSCCPPSGNPRARTRRSAPVVIASMRAPRGISITAAAKERPTAPPPLRANRPAMTAITTPKPTMMTTPITTTRILSPRIGLIAVADLPVKCLHPPACAGPSLPRGRRRGGVGVDRGKV